MGTSYTRNDTSNNIADGNIINATDLDGEFDAIQSAFATTGHTHDGTAAEGGPITVAGPTQDLVVSATNVNPKTTNTLDLGTSSLLYKDAYLQGVMNFRDTNLTISSSTDGQLDIDADGELEIVAPIVDINASTGLALDGANLNSAWTINTNNKIQFRDTGLYINSSADGQLDIVADTEIQIAATTIDINGAINASGEIIAASLDISGNIDVDGTTNLDVVDIDGAVDMATTLAVAGNVDFNGDLDVDGTTNLDVVDIDGAVDMATTLAVAGNVDFNGDLDVDGITNLDVVDIDGAVNMATTLLVTGNADFNGDLDVAGTTNLDVVDIDGAVDMASTLQVDGAITNSSTIVSAGKITADAGIDIDNFNIDGTTIALSSGNMTLDVAGNVTIDADGGTVTFADGGSSLGTITSSGYSGTAAVATTVTVTDNESTNENNAIIFTAGGDLDGGNLGLESDGDMHYNPSTGTLTVPNVSVSGTFSTVNSVTMDANNAVIFEGSTADAHETTLTSVDATADRTITLPNVSGTVPVLAAASNTQVTSTPEELNKLDGATVVVGEINALDLGSTAIGTAIASKAVVLDANKDYTGIRNLTTTGVITGGTVEATTDTAAGDNAAMGYTAAEGLILTGQGSSNDVTIKNDADATVMSIATGTTNATFAGDVTLTTGDLRVSDGESVFVNLNDSPLVAVTGTVGNKEALTFERNGASVKGSILYQQSPLGFSIGTDTGHDFFIRTGGTQAVEFDGTTQNATFAGDVTLSAGKIEATHNSNHVAKFTQAATSLSNANYTLYVDSSSQTSNMTAAGAFGVEVNSGVAFSINGTGNATFAGAIVQNYSGIAEAVGITGTGTGGAYIKLTENDYKSWYMGIDNASTVFKIRPNSLATASAFEIDNSNNATFAGAATVNGAFNVSNATDFGSFTSSIASPILVLNNTNSDSANVYLDFRNNGATKSRIQKTTDHALVFYTNGTSTALTLDNSQNATFAGSIDVGNDTNVTGSATTGYIKLNGNGYNGWMSMDATSLHIGHNSPARSLILETNSTDALTINGSQTATFAGQISMQTSPAFVKGGIPAGSTEGFAIRPNGAGGGQFIASGCGSYTGGFTHQQFLNGNGAVGTIQTSGSSTLYNTSSDYRLKENVVTDWDATTRLKQLKPSRFNFIVDADTTVDGFLAHEAQAVVPECVTGLKDAMKDEEYEVSAAVEATYDDDGNELTAAVEAVMATRSVPDYQGIDQSKLVPLLVKTIQELEARITALET